MKKMLSKCKLLQCPLGTCVHISKCCVGYLGVFKLNLVAYDVPRKQNI